MNFLIMKLPILCFLFKLHCVLITHVVSFEKCKRMSHKIKIDSNSYCIIFPVSNFVFLIFLIFYSTIEIHFYEIKIFLEDFDIYYLISFFLYSFDKVSVFVYGCSFTIRHNKALIRCYNHQQFNGCSCSK